MKLLVFGCGYTARVFVKRLGAEWDIASTTRGEHGPMLPEGGFDGVSHILISIPPDETGDPVFDGYGERIGELPGLRWLGYLSTTGVYGTRDGGWVDEDSELRATNARSKRRAEVEADWLDLWRYHGVPTHIFRLAGIYGLGRSAFDGLRAGTARRIDAGNQVFSRIHVDDIASVLLASIERPRPGAIYNVCDDEPAAQEAVVAHAARLLGMEPPLLVPLTAASLSPMARSFYADNKRVSNALIKSELGISLEHPHYRAGLAAILATSG